MTVERGTFDIMVGCSVQLENAIERGYLGSKRGFAVNG
jgi:hypothetical protein